MPISQKTILSLYGELHALTYAIETAYNDIAAARAMMQGRELARREEAILGALRSRATAAERAAIDTIIEDAPKIEVNPLTGDIE